MQLAKLPVSVHSKVLKWAIQFQADPTSPGINYEKIHKARDPNLKSVRLDRDWRGIVFKPERGDVYMLLYVDHHDDAYRWAENRKLAINPVTGAMQLVFIESGTEQIQVPTQPNESPLAVATTPTIASASLFAAIDDHALMSLGVPEESLPLVRGIFSEADLDEMQGKLPVEAYEGLFLVAAGDSVSSVLNARETRVDQQIDTTDYAKALVTPEAQSRFVVVTDDETMLAIMNAPLAQWRVFLHPTQNKLAQGDRSGPVRVLGGAGTGKTVLAMHRTKWLAENRTPEGKKVLFTTFTKNLATDIEENLRTLCNPQTMEKIEVRNLDAWVFNFMRSKKLEQRIVYDRKQDPASQAWQLALAGKDASLGLSDEFYKDELEQVVLAQGLTTLDSYRMARRTGRGVVLSRSKRDAAWKVFEEYRGQLASRKLKEVDDAYREVAELLGDKPLETYSAIVIDETQDFGPQALKLLRAIIARGTNDLFFVGDGHQRIYSRHRAAMSRCGIDIRGRARKLYLNYRTTDEIRKQAVAMLEGIEVDDLDDGNDEVRRYKSLSHGPAPALIDVHGLEEAAKQVISTINDWRSSEGEDQRLSIAVVAASERIRDTLSWQLEAAGLATVSITAQSNHSGKYAEIHLATMHRAKGLEFDCVIVLSPSSYFALDDSQSNKRNLLYVALTRAKRLAAMLRIE